MDNSLYEEIVQFVTKDIYPETQSGRVGNPRGLPQRHVPYFRYLRIPGPSRHVTSRRLDTPDLMENPNPSQIMDYGFDGFQIQEFHNPSGSIMHLVS